MIPRLAPRRTPPMKSAIGMENDDPMDSSSTAARIYAYDHHPPPPDQETSTPTYRRTLLQRSVLKASTNVLEAPLSPAVTPSYDFLLDPSSALTPPVTGPRPLVVSAKRAANYVRRHNSSKRLRRRTTASTATNTTSSNNSHSNSHGNSNSTTHSVHCLWRDAGAPRRAEESSSEDEDGETLPCHPNPQGYWEYCYGSHGDLAASRPTTSGRADAHPAAAAAAAADTITRSSWSAHRKPPSKGCLSHRNRPLTIQAGLQSFYTPPTTPDDDDEDEASPRTHHKAMTGPRVQFGSPQAVEFDSEGPAALLTPLPSEVTRQRYSMMQLEPSKGEADMSVETKRNSALLAEWEDDGPVQVTSSAARRRQQRNTRRSSSIFTPSPHSTSLLDDTDVAAAATAAAAVQIPIRTMRDDAGRGDKSPATMVLENLASLCVNFPSIEQPIFTPMSISLSSESSSSSSSSSASSNQVGTASTADLAISLRDMNTHGGAVATTMVRHLTSPDAGYTAGVATMSLQAIHSVGGALGTGPAHEGRQLSPISRMSHSNASAGTVPPPLTPDQLLSDDGLARCPSSPTVDIVQTLLKDPSADQTFEPKDILLALARKTSRKQQKSQRNNTLVEIIHSVSPQWDGVLSCLEDLKEQVRFCANTRSNTKFRLPASQETYAKQMVIREWKELEMEFIFELSQALERNTEQARILWQTATSLLEGLKGVLVPCKTNSPAIVANATMGPKQTKEQLESDIVKLEQEILKQQRLAQFREAAEAPYSALFCQAASHIGVCGFRLDDYNGATLQLAYEHRIAGVESHFAHDMAVGQWSATYLSDAFISSPELLPTSHPAAKFHENVALACFTEKKGLLQGVRDMDLSDAVLVLSTWLAGLDAATQELVDVSSSYDCSISIDWPRLSILVDGETTLSILYDESMCHSFRPASAVVIQGHKETRLDIVGTLASLVESAVNISSISK